MNTLAKHPWTMLAFLTSTALLASCAAPARKVVLTKEAKQASDFDLWSKAVELTSASSGWVPGKVYTKVEVRDGDKELETTREIWSRLTKDPDGAEQPKVTIVKATADGKDATVEEQTRAAKVEAKRKRARAEGEEKKKFEHPFQKERQPQVKAERSGETRKVGDLDCVGFKWEYTLSDGRVFSGVAWIQKDTGVPVQMVFGMDPLPDKVDALETKVTYQLDPEGRWLAKEMTIEAQGSLLFFTKYVHTRMEFSEHWKKE